MPPKGSLLSRMKTLASKANTLLKETKIVSKSLDRFGHPKAAGYARMAGYGKTKKPKGKKRGKRK